MPEQLGVVQQGDGVLGDPFQVFQAVDAAAVEQHFFHLFPDVYSRFGNAVQGDRPKHHADRREMVIGGNHLDKPP